jgi:hypothetical protein
MQDSEATVDEGREKRTATIWLPKRRTSTLPLSYARPGDTILVSVTVCVGPRRELRSNTVTTYDASAQAVEGFLTASHSNAPALGGT